MEANDLSGREARASAAIAEIALASLEAEPVAWRNKDSGHCGTVLIQGKSPIDCGYEPLYLAPPAPVSVPDDEQGKPHPVMAVKGELGFLDHFDRIISERDEDIDIGQLGSSNYEALMIAALDAFRAAMLHGSDTELQRKAAIHDELCEKYNVESLTDFVDWQRNHIAELEAAPPAPVGEGETAVMPDYQGYTMTQRECFQAGKRAGLAEAVTTACKLPANTPCKDAPEHIWLQTAGVWPENGEFSELTWCSDNQHKDDTLYVRADVVSGNSPAIPDGWKLVPIELTGDMTNAMSEAILDDMHNVDVWRSVLAAAPQQEV